jgi:hypothetical protein
MLQISSSFKFPRVAPLIDFALETAETRTSGMPNRTIRFLQTWQI